MLIHFGFRAKRDQLELSRFCSHACRVCSSVQKWIIWIDEPFLHQTERDKFGTKTNQVLASALCTTQHSQNV